jgi:hypothetical protein
MDPAAARAVWFGRYGGRDVLYVAGIPMPVPGKGEVLSRSAQRASTRRGLKSAPERPGTVSR